MINPTNTSTIRWPAGSTAVTRGSPIKSGGVVMSAYAVKGHESVTRAHACSHHICYTFGRYARTAHSPSWPGRVARAPDRLSPFETRTPQCALTSHVRHATLRVGSCLTHTHTHTNVRISRCHESTRLSLRPIVLRSAPRFRSLGQIVGGSLRTLREMDRGSAPRFCSVPSLTGVPDRYAPPALPFRTSR